jgi:hypothetical protein
MFMLVLVLVVRQSSVVVKPANSFETCDRRSRLFRNYTRTSDVEQIASIHISHFLRSHSVDLTPLDSVTLISIHCTL